MTGVVWELIDVGWLRRRSQQLGILFEEKRKRKKKTFTHVLSFDVNRSEEEKNDISNSKANLFFFFPFLFDLESTTESCLSKSVANNKIDYQTKFPVVPRLSHTNCD